MHCRSLPGRPLCRMCVANVILKLVPSVTVLQDPVTPTHCAQLCSHQLDTYCHSTQDILHGGYDLLCKCLEVRYLIDAIILLQKVLFGARNGRRRAAAKR